MKTPTKKLRVGPLPKKTSTMLSVMCSISVKTDLDRYAALHAQAYGEMVDATLIPHMLEAVMARDRGFRSRSESSLTRAVQKECQHSRLNSDQERPVGRAKLTELYPIGLTINGLVDQFMTFNHELFQGPSRKEACRPQSTRKFEKNAAMQSLRSTHHEERNDYAKSKIC